MSEDPSGGDTAGRGYDPEQDPDADPAMRTDRHPVASMARGLGARGPVS